jgi:ABC-type lipoprotein release transport system permease subunit
MNTNLLKVGFFLAYRQIKRANIWTTLLIVVVMTLTFLNLVVVNGVLVGLIQSSLQAFRERGVGDLIITKLNQKNQIEKSDEILTVLENSPQVRIIASRYVGSGTLNLDYRKKLRSDERPNKAPATIVGINPDVEMSMTNLSKYLKEGRYLTSYDTDGILVGANLVYKYTPIENASFQTLKNLEVGTKLKVTIGKNSKEVTVVGIIKSKTDQTDSRVFMLDSEAKKLIGRPDANFDEISVKTYPKYGEQGIIDVKQSLLNNSYDDNAKIQTWEDAQPKFLKDIASTFALLGNMIGSIGLAVASITIFIVIFVNAITRRKFIGILKGIGIAPRVIEISYVFQSIFYAVLGSGIGFALLYGFLVPFIDAHPINFPFSDGILYAPVTGTVIRAAILIITTIIAGYIPARMIVKKNTLDSILGR